MSQSSSGEALGRVELLYTLRCLAAIRREGWGGVIHHRLDNLGVVKKCGRIGRGFRIATAADADLWSEMRRYLGEWGHMTKVFWVKAHAEEGGKKTTCHEKQKKKQKAQMRLKRARLAVRASFSRWGETGWLVSKSSNCPKHHHRTSANRWI